MPMTSEKYTEPVVQIVFPEMSLLKPLWVRNSHEKDSPSHP